MVKNDCPPSEPDFVTVHHGGGVAKRPFFDAKGRFTPEKPIVDYEGLMHWNAAQAEIAHTLYHFEYPRGPGEYPVVHSPIAWILFDHRLPDGGAAGAVVLGIPHLYDTRFAHLLSSPSNEVGAEQLQILLTSAGQALRQYNQEGSTHRFPHLGNFTAGVVYSQLRPNLVTHLADLNATLPTHNPEKTSLIMTPTQYAAYLTHDVIRLLASLQDYGVESPRERGYQAPAYKNYTRKYNGYAALVGGYFGNIPTKRIDQLVYFLHKSEGNLNLFAEFMGHLRPELENLIFAQGITQINPKAKQLAQRKRK